MNTRESDSAWWSGKRPWRWAFWSVWTAATISLAAEHDAAGAEHRFCRLTPLHVGVCQLGKDHLLGKDHSPEGRLEFVLYSFLVEGAGGEQALVDLGPQSLRYCNEMFRRYGFFRDLGPSVPAENRYPDDIVQPYGNVFAQLKSKDIATDRIQHIVFSHLHADHHGMDQAQNGGAAALFPGAMLHASRIGWQDNLNKRKEGRWNSYVDFAFSDFLVERERAGRVRFEDNAEIFPGLRTLYLGGHSICSQAVIVETAEGPAILASDDLFLYQWLADNVLPAIRTSEDQYRLAVDRLVDLAVREQGILIPLHDPVVWKTYRQAGPDWLQALKTTSDRAVHAYLNRKSSGAQNLSGGKQRAQPAENDVDTFLQLGPMVGHTSATATRIWAKASGPARLSLLIGEQEDLSDGRQVEGPPLEPDTDFMGCVAAQGLEPSRRYVYSPLLNGKRALLPPYPSFKTAPPDGTPGRVRFAFISCLGYHGYDSAASWGDMTRTNFDLLLLLGDNHYANSAEPKVQRAAYFDHRQVAGFRAIASHIPTYAIWDDHDYGPDNSDGTLRGKEKSLKTFQEHWANPAYGEPDVPGIYYSFTHGPVEFFMLDDRYYRTPDKQVDAPDRTMLGTRQLAWLKRRLLASQAPVKILAAGSEWQSHSTEDCWSNFKKERDEIFQFVLDHNIQGIFLISGDRHFTAAYQVLGKFIEVTSGPFGSSNARSKPLPEMFLYFGEGKIYCILDVNVTGPEPALTLEVYRAGDGLLTRRPFAWKEVLGEIRIAPMKPPPPKN